MAIWTESEKQFVDKNFLNLSYKEIALTLNRPVKSVRQYCHTKGLKKQFIWTDEQKHFVENNYLTMTYEEIGECIGRDEVSVRNYCYLSGLQKVRKWTLDEKETVYQWYIEHPTGELGKLSTLLNRTKPEISLLARHLGLTDKRRPASESERKVRSKLAKLQFQKLGYWGGLKGKKHSPETIAILRQKSLDLFKNDKIRAKHSKAVSMGLRLAIRNGYKPGGTNPYSHTKSGRRKDLGNTFFRSSWEANYARYLNWLVSIEQIQEWGYEVDTFEFRRIKKGTRFYTPDFKIFENNGAVVYHEVKGWMDEKSKTKIKRMAKYYPEVILIIVDQKSYKAIEKQVKNFIREWE